MNELARALKHAGKRRYDREAEQAARRLADEASEQGLVDVTFTRMDSPVGPIMVAATRRGLVRISFGRFSDPESFVAELAALSPRVLEAAGDFDAIKSELDEYFEGRRTSFELPIDWSLTGGFGRRVLQRTARIPYGEVSTYRDVAAAAGSPRGARAAGNALGANPIPIVIPCHRVLHSDGGLGGYGGGIEKKQFLLRLEGAIN
jgi:methylated-DNA-[protein]-cysteine S-methyltransferase